jgi:chemotaxis response regulator CheB
MAVNRSEPERVIAFAGSAGCIPVILRVVSQLRAEGVAALFVVYHRAGGHHFDWTPYLRKGGGLRAQRAETGISVEPDILYHPDDAHSMTVRDGVLERHEDGPRPRPNIDLLLMGLAEAYGPRAFAFVLSGLGSDGVAGARRIQAKGGVVIAQDPETAPFPVLPAKVIEEGGAQHVLPAAELVALASHLASGQTVPAALRG